MFPCDFNGDNKVDGGDIQLLTDNLGSNDLRFDVNGDLQFDIEDRNSLIFDKLGTCFGDANADGMFNTDDLVQVFQAGDYETTGVATWETGDWNGDGFFNSGDLVGALQQPCAVPEPSSFLLLGLVAVTSMLWRRFR